MRKTLSLLCFLGFISLCPAQQLMFEVYSGVNATAYELDAYDDTQWHVPIGVRLAGGHEHVQLGVEYRKNISNPAWDNGLLKDEFDQSYYGGFLRANLSSLPAYRFGLVLKAGAGYYTETHKVYALPGEILEGSEEYDKVLGYNAGIGISSPIWTIIHWEIGYQYNFVDREDQLIRENYKASYHSFQMGLSINLVFGNTARKCRRVINDNRSNKGWK